MSAVHHYLINVGKRVQTALIVESGEIREVMHAALLLGYGASALCPYMTYAVLDDLVKKGKIQENYATAEANYIKAVKKGLFKIMAKMGISTIRSYRGAQIFEAVGLSQGLLKAYFGTDTRHRERRGDPPYRTAAEEPRTVPLAQGRHRPRLEPRDDRHTPARHPHR